MKTFYFRSTKFSSSPSFVSNASVRILFLLRGFELGQPLISVHHWSHDMKIPKLIKNHRLRLQVIKAVKIVHILRQTSQN